MSPVYQNNLITRELLLPLRGSTSRALRNGSIHLQLSGTKSSQCTKTESHGICNKSASLRVQ